MAQVHIASFEVFLGDVRRLIHLAYGFLLPSRIVKLMMESVLVPVLVVCTTSGDASSQQESMVGRHLLRAERLLASKDYGGALDAMDQIAELQDRQVLTMPDRFYFRYAEIALSAGAFQRAINAVKQYLAAAGMDGEFFSEAQALLEKAELGLLSPEELVERYLLHADQMLAQNDYRGARVKLNQIVGLQNKHDLTMPHRFHFRSAQVAFTEGALRRTIEAANRYLSATGTEAEFHGKALAIIKDVAERYRRQAERLMDEKDYRRALGVLDAAFEVLGRHRLTVPVFNHYLYGNAAWSVGEIKDTIIALTRYLKAAGPNGKYYREALALLETAEDSVPDAVIIPAGRYRMGCIPGSDCIEAERPVREVEVKSFELSKYEISFMQYDVFANATGRSLPADEGWGRGQRPVINVSWNDAVAYTRWLSDTTGDHYRLPSEAEWEYAARAGTTTKYSWGNLIGDNRANCDGCGSRWDSGRTAPIGSFDANDWGLYDMHGNVWEWVQDCANVSYAGAPAHGSAWTDGDCSRRILRGGSWFDYPAVLRSTYRYWNANGRRGKDIGFRVVRSRRP